MNTSQEKNELPQASGRCLCGAVSYTARDIKLHHHACHCGMCRRWAGGPGFAAAVGGVDWQGEASITRFESSEWGDRGFCKKCGTHLFYHFKPRDEYYVYVGSFDDDTQFELVGEIYVDAQPPGYRFSDGLNRVTGDDFIAMLGGTADD